MFYKTHSTLKWTKLHWAVLTKQYDQVQKLAKTSNIFEQDSLGINPINLALFSLDQKLLSCFNDAFHCHNFNKNFHKDLMSKLVTLNLDSYLIEFIPINPELDLEIAQNYANCYNEINGFTPMAKAITSRDVFRIRELVQYGWSEDIDHYIVKKHHGHIKGFKDVLNKSFENQIRKLVE